MAQAYSDDLRCKLLEAYEAGRGTLREVAAQFRVSWGYSKKIRGQQLRTGQKERPAQSQHGPASRVTPLLQQQLGSALRQQPDFDASRAATTHGAKQRGVAQPVLDLVMAAEAGVAS